MTSTPARPRSPIAPTRPAGGSQPRAERTRALIMDETVRCIIEEGFEAASAKHIAERAGVTWGVIQYHFGDRAGLLAAVIDSGFDELRAQMALVDLPAGPTRQRVTAMVESAWDAFSTPTSRASLEILVATRGRRDPATDAHLADMAGELSRLGRHVIDDPGPSRDPSVVGELLWATLRGLVLAQMVVTEPIDSGRERAFLVDLLTAYLEPTDPSTTRIPERTTDD
jgi:TetR/AcrR family transcriptional regulator, regulator of cefoperazone and chloramphenicol sensitivity